MKIDIHTLIGQATAYDKKQQIEAKRADLDKEIEGYLKELGLVE